jgi:DNA-binding beta-propeller fold protein YncE
VYVFDVRKPAKPRVREIMKTGLKVGEWEYGIGTYSGSHPNSVAVGKRFVYVANGNNDLVSVLHPRSYKELGRISLSILKGGDRKLKGVQPVALALSLDERYLFVAEAGINAVGVVRLGKPESDDGDRHDKQEPKGRSSGYGMLIGHIPAGW